MHIDLIDVRDQESHCYLFFDSPLSFTYHYSIKEVKDDKRPSSNVEFQL